jgi:cation diffusion facilitator family transporter
MPKFKRTPKDIYRVRDSETTPLLPKDDDRNDEDLEQLALPPALEPEEEAGSQSRIVTIAIYVNFAANSILLIMKIIVVALSSSVSVLASLVDAALDFLSTLIVSVTTRLISRSDQYAYPVGRRRLEPMGVLVFSIIMIVSFVQVGLEGFYKLTGPDHSIVQLTVPAIAIMAATVVIKFGCWLWCRLIPNSSVQALAQDAITDVVFNIFSIIFPLVGFYAQIWWLDPLGGILLSLWVIGSWSRTSSTHIRNLTGAAASADERNILLYLTMRFAKTIRKIQGLQAYHSGDKLNVEVDIVLDEHTSLRDSHDLGESLQYVLESVPNVDRAFVHMDYADYNLPSHLQQDN